METNVPNIEFMDTADALARIGGNMGLYIRLLGRFIDGNHFDLLENAIASGDIEEASRQAHTLKGVSANLSLVKINTLTVQIEHMLKNNEDYSQCLDDLREAFVLTTAEITKLTEQGS